MWGKGTAFATREDFLNKITSGGIAAMELVARDMKATGRYIARSLSYDGVEYNRVEHTLSPQQREVYDKLAEGWQTVLNHFQEAMKQTGIMDDENGKTLNGRAKSAILSQFWGGHQRFFNQVITSMQMPTVLKEVEKDVKAGRQAVLQIVNTNEAAQERALQKIEGEAELEDLDMTPRDQLLQLVDNAYPTQRYEEYFDEDGNKRSRPVVDSKGNPVRDPALVRRKEKLLDELGSIRVPDGPLEMLMNHFGTDKVAEVTGRRQRVVKAPDPETGQMRTVVEKRTRASGMADADLFQEGKKPVLIFSDAGGTGRSYHAEKSAPSAKSRRVHYLVQGGWRADKAVQGFGRTHRTNQESAPIFRLVTTDLQGQKRFISSIARRLAQLGALTKGERRTGDQGMFGMRDNLESDEAKAALTQLYRDVIDNKVEGIGLDDLEQQMGLKLLNPADGSMSRELPPMTQFLNRLLSLKVDTQNRLFNAFDQRLSDTIERAAAAGTLDTGVETYKADKITKVSDQVVYTDPQSGAETKHVQLRIGQRNRPAPFSEIESGRHAKLGGKEPLGYVRSRKSGKVFAVGHATSYTDEKGNVVDQRRLVGPTDYQFVDAHRIENTQNWEHLPVEDARKAWDETVAKIPEFSQSDLHLITGAVLPIWDRLAGSPKIFRLQTDKGERMLGRVVPNDVVNATLDALGAEKVQVKATPKELGERVLGGETARFANGWKLKRSLVAGEPRIELVGPDYQYISGLEKDGLYKERIDWQTRLFVPTGADMEKVLRSVMEGRPVLSLDRARGEGLAEEHAPYGGQFGSGEPGEFTGLLDEALQHVKAGPGAQTDIRNYLLSRQAETGHETFTTYDIGRRSVMAAATNNEPHHVEVPPNAILAMENPASNIVSHHNHPAGTAPSPPDLVSLGMLGHRYMVVHAGTDHWHGVALTPQARDALLQEKTYGRRLVMKSTVEEAQKAITKDMRALIRSGAVDRDTANRWHAGLINLALERAGITDYTTSDALPQELAALFKPVIMDGARNAAQQFRYLGLDHDRGRIDQPYRPAEPLRFDEGMARFLGGNETGAGQPGREGVAPEGAGTPRVGRGPRGERLAEEPEPYREPFYSALTKGVEDARMTRAPAGDWRGLIDNLRSKGVKQDEIDWSGVRDWLAAKTGPVTKDEVAAFLRENEVKVQEVMHSDKTFSPEDTELDAEIRKLSNWPDRPTEAKFPNDQKKLDGLIEEWGKREAAHSAPTKFKQYALPGGNNYRELLLTLPEKPAISSWRIEPDKRSGRWKVVNDAGDVLESDIGRERAEQAVNRGGTHDAQYHSAHWDEPNVLAHVRFDDRTGPNGEKVLHIAEVQSDWGQELRKSAALRSVSKPQSVRELSNNFFGGHLPSPISLSEVDGGVLALADHNEVRRGIVSLLPIDVVNELGGRERLTENFLRNPAMVLKSLSADRRAPVAQVILNAARKVFAEARTKLSDGLKTGRDVEILPALRASQLTAREVVSVLSPESLYHKGLSRNAVGSDVTLGRTEKTTLSGTTEGDGKGLPATDTEFLNRPLAAGKGAVSGSRATASFDGERGPATIAKALDWHNRILKETGTSEPVQYIPVDTPSMPLERSWPELAMKRMLRFAVDHGYDKLTWDTGATNADRYDLSKQVAEIYHWRDSDGDVGISAYDHSGHSVIDQQTYKPSKLEGVVGKDVADKILKGEGDVDPSQPPEVRVLRGDDLKVGGKGMKSFYDKILPQFMAKYVKKWDAKIEDATIRTAPIGYDASRPHEVFNTKTGEVVARFATETEAKASAKHRGNEYDYEKVVHPDLSVPVHQVSITPAMRESVMRGQPLFEEAEPYGAEPAGGGGGSGGKPPKPPLPPEPPGPPPMDEGHLPPHQRAQVRGVRQRFEYFLGPVWEGVASKLKDRANAILPDTAHEWLEEAKLRLTPMAAGSERARAAAKDFITALRNVRDQWGRVDDWLVKNFDREALTRIYNAMDEQGTAALEGRQANPDRGVESLTPAERAVAEELNKRASAAMDRAIALGMTKADKLPWYVPRMIVQMTEEGPLKVGGKSGASKEARNLRTTTPQLLHRKYLHIEETEEAARKKFGAEATVVRNIRALALATKNLETAIAGRTLVDKIKAIGKDAGEDLVEEGSTKDPHGTFTLDHPAFRTFQPKFVRDAEGRYVPQRDEQGNIIFESQPLYINKEFEGPLRAVLSTDTSRVYNAVMSLKGRMMGVIMWSPLMHNAVIWGKAFPAAPLQLLTPVAYRGEDGKFHYGIKLYVDGQIARQDPAFRSQMIADGVDPIGKRYGMQDISTIAEDPIIKPGRSWTAKAIGGALGLFDPELSDATKRKIDRFGDLWHNEFLWERVADLQAGLYKLIKETETRRGLPEGAAGQLAADFANQYAGALPIESMSKGARQMANIILFSRSFTLSNMKAWKTLVTGLPLDVQSRILRDHGVDVLNEVQGVARRKAISLVALDIAMQHAGLFLAAGALSLAWYALNGQWRFHNPEQNEPGRTNRVFVGYDKTGTAIYARLPTGKVGEDLAAWMTEPRGTFLRKLSPFARLSYEVLANDKGFGKRLFDEQNNGMSGWAQTIGAVVGDSMESVFPVSQFRTVEDLVQQHEPAEAATAAVLPALGITLSHGYPGGPALGEYHDIKARHNFLVEQARPGILRQIRGGDFEGARKRMTELGIPPREQHYYFKVAGGTRSGLSARQRRDLASYASPEDIGRIQQAQQRQRQESGTP